MFRPPKQSCSRRQNNYKDAKNVFRQLEKFLDVIILFGQSKTIQRGNINTLSKAKTVSETLVRAKTVSGQEIHSDRPIQVQRGKKYVQASKNNF